MKIKQINYAKVHEFLRSDSQNYKVANTKKNVPTNKDKKIIKDILKIIKENYEFFKNFGGEWDFVNINKRSKYINAIKDKNFEALLKLFTNMFQNVTTYGVVTPSFNDVKNKKIYVSQILNDLDAAIEFAGLTNLNKFLLKKDIGNPYGISFNEKILMPDTPRHYYFSRKILNLIKKEKLKNILEIGGGYGGMAKIISTLDKNFRYYSVDLFEGCLIQYFFLCKSNIKAKIIFDIKDSEKNTINLIPFSKSNVNFLKKINKVDLVFNSRSFSELNKSVIRYYFNFFNKFIKPKYIYHENANFLLFPESERHIEILAKDFPINNDYNLINFNVSVFSGGGGRYREMLYKRKNN